MSDFRRGVPVLLRGEAATLILAAETADTVELDAAANVATTKSPTLVVTAARAAAILRRPMPSDAAITALQMADGRMPERAVFEALADPTAQPLPSQALRMVETPADARAAVQLAKLCRLLPAVLMFPVGMEPANVADIGENFLPLDVNQIEHYAEAEPANLRLVASADVPLVGAPDSRVIAFRTEGSPIEHFAIAIGHPEQQDRPLVRLHSECFTGDVLGSMRCDCGDQLHGAVTRMAAEGGGVLLYLGQEGRGIGLINKLRAYRLQDRGLDTVDANRALGWGADERDFGIGAAMLRLMGILRVRLLTNNPSKVAALQAAGIEVTGREPHQISPNGVNDDYLATKAARFGHMLDN
jgi:GTP cyclohydrolase II